MQSVEVPLREYVILQMLSWNHLDTFTSRGIYYFASNYASSISKAIVLLLGVINYIVKWQAIFQFSNILG